MQTEGFILAWVLFCSLVRQAFFYEDYSVYLLDRDTVCSHALQKRILKLGYENKSGIIVRQERLFEEWSGKYDFDCVFTIDAGVAGIAAVIQNMKFRTSETDDHNTTCLDYVQFASGDKTFLTALNIKFSNSQKWSQKYCGEVSLKSGKNVPASNGEVKSFFEGVPTGENTFVEPNGFLDVKIHIGPKPSWDKQLELEMAFTSYTHCRYNMGMYKMCGGPICIWKEYFNDDVVNCPFLECTDESLCGDAGDSKSITTGLGTKVLLGAVAGVFTMVFVLILFFWTFHYCNFLCTPKPPAHLTELSSVPPGEEERRAPTCTTPLSPSASEEKDLPPAYETLFPVSEPVS